MGESVHCPNVFPGLLCPLGKFSTGKVLRSGAGGVLVLREEENVRRSVRRIGHATLN